MNQNHDEGLDRRLSLFPVTNIVIANMIGAGIFTTSGLLMEQLGNPLLMIGIWVLGGVIALCGALSYGELGATLPRAGGEYAFLSQLYHPMLGFLSGWVSLIVGFSAPIAASAIGFSEYLFRAFPQSDFFSPAMPELKKGVAIVVILGFTIIHLRGIEFGARVQNLLTLLKIGLIVGLVAAGFAFGHGRIEHFTDGGSIGFFPPTLKKTGLALMWVMFAYSGWNAATYIGSEIRQPQQTLPRSLLVGTGTVMVIYLFLNILFIFAVSPSDMAGVISIGGLAAANLFGQAAEIVISVLIAFALFSSLSAFIILGPRVYYAMGRDGLFFASLSKVHPRFRVPTKAILLQAGLAIFMVLSGTFDQILTYMGFSLGIFPLFAVGGIFLLRQRGLHSVRLPGFPLTQLFYILTGIAILVLAYLERPLESSIAIVTVLCGIPVYWGFHRRKVFARLK